LKAVMLVLAVGVLFTVSPSVATGYDPCSGQPTLSGTLGYYAIHAGSVTVYIVDRGIIDHGVWIYEESNGVDGLQRGGLDPTGLFQDPCIDSTGPPDTLIAEIWV
jgi:hypothetical protein